MVPVLNIFLCHFYGLKECRPGKIVVDLSKIIEVNSSLIKLGQCMCNQVKIGNNFIRAKEIIRMLTAPNPLHTNLEKLVNNT